MLKPMLRTVVIGMLVLCSWLPSPAAIATPLESMHLATLPGLSTLFAGQRPANLGVKDGKLSPCPKSPNCVVSQGNPDSSHAIAPIAYEGEASAAMAKLQAVVASQPRTQIIEQTDTYLYVEFASQLMGFVDDVEFLITPEASVIQVRSASRLGESDLGVNRKRIETIRSQFRE